MSFYWSVGHKVDVDRYVHLHASLFLPNLVTPLYYNKVFVEFCRLRAESNIVDVAAQQILLIVLVFLVQYRLDGAPQSCPSASQWCRHVIIE